jgi:hypothetical protein
VFSAGFQLPLFVAGEIFKDVLQQPPAVYLAVDRSGMRGTDADTAAVGVVADQSALLASFIQGQRQQALISGLPNWSKQLDTSNMMVRYVSQQGTERIEIIVRPTYEPKKPTNGRVIDIVSDFRAWPYAGAQTFDDPPHIWTAFVNAGNFAEMQSMYDPAFAPADDHGGEPLLAPVVSDDVHNLLPKGYIGRDNALAPATANGLAKPLWLTDIAGGKAYDEKLEGKQYWEVELMRLPDAVPDGYTVTFPDAVDDGSRRQGLTFDSRPQSYKRIFDKDLNTFFNPVIGLAPAYFLNGEDPPPPDAPPPTGNPANSTTNDAYYIHKIGGLDPDETKPRSIAMIRSSTKPGDLVNTGWNRTIYELHNVYKVLSTTSDFTTRWYILYAYDHTFPVTVGVNSDLTTDVPGATLPVPMPTKLWHPFDMVANGDYVYIVDGVQEVRMGPPVRVTLTPDPFLAPITGPPPGLGWPHTPGKDRLLERFSWGGGNWYCIGKVGDTEQAFKLYEGALTPGSLDLRLGVVSELYPRLDRLFDPVSGLFYDYDTGYISGEITVWPDTLLTIQRLPDTDGLDPDDYINVVVPAPSLGSVNTGPITKTAGFHYAQTFPGIFGDMIAYDDDSGAAYVAVPRHAPDGRSDSTGQSAPVIKGRLDRITEGRLKPSHGHPAPFPNHNDDIPTGSGPLPGYDTGVNLGVLKVGGRVMIATDTKTRKVWFGYDGVFYGQNGPLTAKQLADGEGFACLMDVAPGIDPATGKAYTPDYRAAAWYRYGPTWLRMHLGPSVMFQPPGFELLGVK